MDIIEKTILDESIKYRELYYSTPWWRFRKRRKYYVAWQRGLRSLVNYYG